MFAPPPGTAQDPTDKYGITAEEAGDASPDLRWLWSAGEDVHWHEAGSRLPVGLEAYGGREHNDLLLWAESVGAVIAGDTLGDFGAGLAVNERLRGAVTRQQVIERLLPLLDLPVEVVCPAHGAPTDRAAHAPRSGPTEKCGRLWLDSRRLGRRLLLRFLQRGGRAAGHASDARRRAPGRIRYLSP